MAVVWGGGDGIRIACFVGQAVLDKVHARVVHARASDGSAPRRGRGTRGSGVAVRRGARRRRRGVVLLSGGRKVHPSTLEGRGIA